MATWLPGIPPDTTRIELQRVTLGGPRSAVVAAVYRVVRADGPPVDVDVSARPAGALRGSGR